MAAARSEVTEDEETDSIMNILLYKRCLLLNRSSSMGEAAYTQRTSEEAVKEPPPTPISLPSFYACANHMRQFDSGQGEFSTKNLPVRSQTECS